MRHAKAGAALTAGLMALGVAAAAPASAAQSTQVLDCGSLGTVTISVPDNHSSDNGGWSAGRLVGSTGHLIPTSFTFSAYDVTAGQALFSGTQLKGGGEANQNQSAITCSQTQTGTLADFGPPPGGPLPPGLALTDTVTVTLTVTAIPKV